MARKIRPDEIEGDLEALISLALQVADREKFFLTAARLSEAFDALQLEYGKSAQGIDISSGADVTMSPDHFTVGELEEGGELSA